MKNISFYCLSLNPSHEKFIKELSYIPVGLGEKIFSDNWLSDKNGENISYKNKFYGEYTFHYWLWKNHLHKLKSEWVGFFQYRKFFVKESVNEKDLKFEDLKNIIIKKIDFDDKQIDCVLGKKFSVKNFKFSKIIKNHFIKFISNPSFLFFKEKRNLKFHFDLFHGDGNLELAINCLDSPNREEFKLFMNNNNSFNPHNMFICKTKFLAKYYETVFPWLKKCEDKFGFDKLEGYGLQRIYGFLAERFLSYWFNKHCRVMEMPIVVKDLSDYKNF